MRILNHTDKETKVVKYVPHGINSTEFKKVDVPKEFKEGLFGKDKDYKFVLFWMNRNIKRKQPSDVIWAFSKFANKLPEKDRNDVCLVMHTNPVDENGTDLPKVAQVLAPNLKVIFSTKRVDTASLNYLYNLADITINIAGNEGFGLTTAESIMAGTPTIIGVTGGLQDQLGLNLKLDGSTFSADDYKNVGTLHNKKVWEHKLNYGEWVKPVWPSVHTMVGSVPTPYIIDDKVDVDEVADKIMEWYETPKAERENAGLKGREWMLSEQGGLSNSNMCKQMMDGIEATIKNFKPKPRYRLYKIR